MREKALAQYIKPTSVVPTRKILVGNGMTPIILATLMTHNDAYNVNEKKKKSDRGWQWKERGKPN